jgi:hypothetical protein
MSAEPRELVEKWRAKADGHYKTAADTRLAIHLQENHAGRGAAYHAAAQELETALAKSRAQDSGGEAVYQWRNLDGLWRDCDANFYKRVTIFKKRTLYTAAEQPAKVEAVAWVSKNDCMFEGGWSATTPILYSQPGHDRIPLYTTPQPSDPADALICGALDWIQQRTKEKQIDPADTVPERTSMFALRALVAAGHVSQRHVNQALAIARNAQPSAQRPEGDAVALIGAIRSALVVARQFHDTADGLYRSGMKRDVWQQQSERIDAAILAIDSLRAVLSTPPSAEPQAGVVDDAVVLIAAERRRQTEVEGWTPEHDDGHRHSEMAEAAACYASLNGRDAEPPVRWPWDERWWKPKGRVRDLVRAGALIAAEIDRLQRAALAPATGEGEKS